MAIHQDTDTGRPPGEVRPRAAARFGLGPTLAAARAVLGSLLLFALMSLTLGQWEGRYSR